MNELGLPISSALAWFPHAQEEPYILVRVSEEHANLFADVLRDAVRRCYLTDANLQARTEFLERETQREHVQCQREVIAATLPDSGSVMSGDFGEILGYVFQAVEAHPTVAFGAKKWRLKTNRRQAAPYSDLVHFVLPSWPMASEDDVLICTEVKTKATDGSSLPIQEAIDDCNKDRTSRLSKTLLWLREKAILGDLGIVELSHLQRFINATDYPAAKRRFYALAVICTSLLEAELETAPSIPSDEYRLAVVAVPNLHTVYNAVYAAVQQGGNIEVQAA